MNIQKFTHQLLITVAELSQSPQAEMLRHLSPDQAAEADLEPHLAQWREVSGLVFKTEMSKEEAFITLLGLLSDLKHDDPLFTTGQPKPLTHVNFGLCCDGVAARLRDYGIHEYEEGEDTTDAMTAEEAFKLICSMVFAYRGSAARTIEPHKRFLSLIAHWDKCTIEKWRPKK